jgi:hypothetical protein
MEPITMSDEELVRVERALAKYDECQRSGSTFTLEVNKDTGDKQFLGFCKFHHRFIDIEPTCRICLRIDRKKKKPSKKTATQINRIKQGRKRQKQRKEAGKNLRAKSSR